MMRCVCELPLYLSDSWSSCVGLDVVELGVPALCNSHPLPDTDWSDTWTPVYTNRRPRLSKCDCEGDGCGRVGLGAYTYVRPYPFRLKHR
jgi:hypothetical protein